ncbi:MAG TPA: hypothetical protein VFX19_06625 [Dehalococcoidia bacterium]|nr:hypothetical protein [Dehalococcoidia bacterium]
MLRRAMRLVRMDASGPDLFWLNRDLAISGTRNPDHWPVIFDAGIRYVVDLTRPDRDRAAGVRQNGMRYLALCIEPGAIPRPEELHILSRWAIDRMNEQGRVLIQDSNSRFNDGLVAVAILVKSGLPAHLALLALRRARPELRLDREQSAVLVRFATDLSVDAEDLTEVTPG